MAQLNPNREQLARLIDAFREVKAENDTLLSNPGTSIFVETHVYRQVQNTRRPLLIGRKGAGKTALLLGYRNEHEDKYIAEAAIDIKADQFPIETLFSFFYTDYRRSVEAINSRTSKISDIPGFAEPVRLATFAWLQSLMSAAIYTTAGKLLTDPLENITSDQRKLLTRARRAIEKWMGKKFFRAGGDDAGGEVVFTLLVYFFQTLQSAIDKILETHNGEIAVLLAGITRTVTRALSGKPDKAVEAAATEIKKILKHRDLRTLITLDKFDDFYDEFYRSSERSGKANGRREFLSIILQGLVLAARELNRKPEFAWLDSIIAIPMDKFLEIHLRERLDLEVAQVLRLEWTPSELLEYVNRRISYALNLPESESDNSWDRLFPFDVTNGRVKDTKEDSFLYIVRHTLWKPREVQMYLSALFEEMESSRAPADEEMFRRVVSKESEKIIRREFLEEFSSEFPGVSRILKKLENVDLQSVMAYELVLDRLKGLSLFEESMRPDEVLLRLYHMGIVGVRQVFVSRRVEHSDSTITQQKQEVSYRFSYNYDGNDPFTQGISVVFHPMFFEYLNIEHEEPYVVNQLVWEMFGRQS